MPISTTPLLVATSRRERGGFTLLDMLIGIAVLSIALLSQVSSTLSSHRLLNTQSLRTRALDAGRQVMARVRADEAWGSLYARLQLRQKLAADGSAPMTFLDGQGAWAPQAYFPDFVPSSQLQDVGVLIQVPEPQPPASNPAGTPVLREDVADTSFGLPADLNTDTRIDGEARNGDYQILPVILRMRWRGAQGGVEEIRITSWLRGER